MNVVLTRQTATASTPGAYRMDITITSAEDITTYLFVKERIKNPDGSNNDTFVAVASPAQIEDFGQGTPNADSSYFTDTSISLVSTDPALFVDIFNDIVADIQLTQLQTTELTSLTPTETFTITSTSITGS